jgi:outer membrane receptor protein involved in Fe transport
MRVKHEPTSDDPRQALDEILRQNGLAALEGPGGQLVVVAAPGPPTGAALGAISGRVTTAEPGIAAVTLVGQGRAVNVHAPGDFRFENLPPGSYAVRAEQGGLLPQTIDGVVVRDGQTSRVRFDLVSTSVFLNEIVVTPSHFRILADQPEVRQVLSREEVEQMPHAADDLFRAIKRLPGAGGGDISAKLNIRGGGPDEVLVMLDGLELDEPFHLKDFQSIFSTIDAEAVGGVDLITGAFPIEYGDRMSAVMDISIATPTGPASASFGLGTINSRALGEGTFDSGKGQWLVSGRAWYPDLVINAVGTTVDDILSDYYDVIAKVQHQLGRRSTLSANVLAALDDIGFRSEDPDELEEVRARYRSAHLWLNLRTEWSPALFSRIVASRGRVRRERVGSVDDEEEGALDVVDDRTFDVLGLRQDWSLALSDRQLLKWGLDLKHQRADHDYSSLSSFSTPDLRGAAPDLILARLTPEEELVGAYIGHRMRLGERLVAEAGVRWDAQRWSGDGDGGSDRKDDHQVSPRLNMRLSAGPRTTLRAAWGRYHQSQRLNEIQIEDGTTTLSPAQRSEHWLASIEHRFRGGLGLRLEAYSKRIHRPRPYYENLFNPFELFPEARDDRVLVAPDRGRARGIELLVKGSPRASISWWLSYALASAEDEIEGEMVPRSWDQRHSASLGLSWALDSGWSLSLAGTAHSGWPTTAVTGRVVGEEDGEPIVELLRGERNRRRYPGYLRLDMRARRTWQLERGELSLIIEVINLMDRRNVCCTDDHTARVLDDGSVAVVPEEAYWAPIVPSLGLRWRL